MPRRPRPWSRCGPTSPRRRWPTCSRRSRPPDPTVEAVRLPGEPTALRVAAGLDLRDLTATDGSGRRRSTPRRSRAGRDHGLGRRPRRPRHAPSIRARRPRRSATPSRVVSSALLRRRGAPFAYPLDLARARGRRSASRRTSSRTMRPSPCPESRRAATASSARSTRPSPSGWRATSAFFGQPHRLVTARTDDDALSVSTGGAGAGRSSPAATTSGAASWSASHRRHSRRSAATPTPVVVTDAFLAGDRTRRSATR